jgi:hypothetical protein
MSNNILYTVGTPIVIADATYSPGANTTLGTRTDDIDVTDLAAAAARQSDKIDLGATRAPYYDVRVTFEPATDPATGGSLQLYWSASHSGTAAVGNMAGCSGADGAYTGYSTILLAAALTQMELIGIAPAGIANDGDGVQISHVGIFSPSSRYGCVVVYNNMSVALHSDSVEFAILLEPIIPQIQ